MTPRTVATSFALISVLAAGCGESESDRQKADGDLSTLAAELAAGNDSAAVSDSGTPSARLTPFDAELAVATAPAAEPLRLTLTVGDRFPLIKTVRQTLEQKSERYPAHSVSELELTMSIQVEETRADAALLSVRYHRVRYSHVLDSQQVSYDSATHQGELPADVAPYAGMVNSGFQFWLGHDNQIRELVGYQNFLLNCVQHVPIEQRGQLLADIAGRFGDDAVASFVDDSIGILPFNSEYDSGSASHVTVGSTWQKQRRLMNPAPVHLNASCRLVELEETTARIQVSEEIAPAETLDSTNSPGPQLTVSGGHGSGTCIIDRRTGLPLDVRLERFLLLSVHLPGGETVNQEKMILTTIRAFPQAVAQTGPGPAGTNIQQVAGQQPSHPASVIPTTTTP